MGLCLCLTSVVGFAHTITATHENHEASLCQCFEMLERALPPTMATLLLLLLLCMFVPFVVKHSMLRMALLTTPRMILKTSSAA